MGASIYACTLAGRTISCAGAERFGCTTETVARAISSVSLCRVARACMRGRIPETTTATTNANARIAIQMWCLGRPVPLLPDIGTGDVAGGSNWGTSTLLITLRDIFLNALTRLFSPRAVHAVD